MFLLRCPKCHKDQKYHTYSNINNKRKTCVYCGKSFKVKEQIVKVTLGEGKGRFRNHFSFRPEKYEVHVPDFDIEIPEIDIEIPEIDIEELQEMDEKIKEEFEKQSEELDKLKEELKGIKIHSRYNKSIVI